MRIPRRQCLKAMALAGGGILCTEASHGGSAQMSDRDHYGGGMPHVIDECYVSVRRGEDDNPGTKQRPFASIERAREYVRAVSGSVRSDTTVWIEEGLYELDAPLAFGPQDSGKNGRAIAYKAVDGHAVVVSGGRKVRVWEPVEGSPIWRTRAPEAAGAVVAQFCASGRLKPRASFSGRYYLQSFSDEAFRSGRRLTAPASALQGVEDATGMFVDFLIGWCQYRLPVASVDTQGNSAELLIARDYPIHRLLPTGPVINEEHPFALENHPHLLDSPGEWYFDPEDRYLYYYPEQGETVDTLEAFIPVHERVLVIAGNEAEGPVRRLRFEGITFGHTGYANPTRFGYLSSHSDRIVWPEEKEHTIPAAVFIEHAEDIRIENCELRQLGSTGVGIRKRTESVVLSGNLIRQAGACGISVGYLQFKEYERHPDPACIPVDVVIQDNVLDGVGLELRTNNGITVYHAKRAQIAHNFIRNTPHCGLAIITDFTWNPHYEEGNTMVGDHLVSGNLIVDSGRELYDGAPIYVLYRNCGENRITRNCILIDELGSRGNMCGIYLDEGSTNYTVTQNVVDVPYNSNGGWMFINEREPRLPRILSVHNNYTTNEYLGREPWYSDTLDGTIANDSYRIYVRDTHCRRSNEAWPAEAVEIIRESGPRQTRFTEYAHMLRSCKDRILRVQDEMTSPQRGHYQSYALKGDNLVPNGDFESGSYQPWYPEGCGIEVTDEEPYEGRYCLKVANRRFFSQRPRPVPRQVEAC